MVIPDAVLGAAVGSIITLLGVFLSNQASYKRLERQLQHEAEQREIDRQRKLKQELFMKIAEELGLAKILLMKLPSMSMSDFGSNDGQVGISIESIKAHVIGSNKTVQALTEVTTTLGKALLWLVPKKIPIESVEADIAVLTRQIDESLSKRNNLLERMAEHNLNPSADPRVFNALQSNFESFGSQLNGFINEREKKQVELNNLQRDMIYECQKTVHGLLELEAAALASLREELGLPFDMDEYKSNMRAAQRDVESEFVKFMSRITA